MASESDTWRSAAQAQCRFCGAPLEHTFVDLGMSPLCQTQIAPGQLNHMEPFYPLHVWVCDSCFLVQLEQYVAPSDIFAADYPYFSSYSDSWVEHARRYAHDMIARFGLNERSLVMEIASNDGYLLQHFVKARVPCLGVEPAANVARAALDKGVKSEVCFFGEQTAARVGKQHGKPDLLLGNNVLAHVPDLNDFVKGMKTLLAPGGVITMEFPHLLQLMLLNQFDTIYHEHFSYLSLIAVERIFARHGLSLFDVQELATHGGSLRIFARHIENDTLSRTTQLGDLVARERAYGLDRLETYSDFQERTRETKRKLLEFLIGARTAGKKVVGYGAPGKGNTLLNYCGIRTDFLDYTVDRNPHKQGTFTPGTRIPILDPNEIAKTRPDYVLILPWNLKDEIMAQLAYIRDWGGQFVVPIPTTLVL